MCGTLPVCVAKLLGDYFIIILGKSLGQVPGEETHQRPALAASSAAPERKREDFQHETPREQV